MDEESRPKPIILFEALQYGGFGVGFLSSMLSGRVGLYVSPIALGVLAVLIWLIWLVARRRKTWPVVIFVVLNAVGVPLFIWGIVRTFHADSLLAICVILLNTIAVLMQAASVLVLFSPDTRPWFANISPR